MNYKILRDGLKEIAEISLVVPEQFQQKYFETLLNAFIEKQSNASYNFLIEAYKTTIDYLNSYFDRVYNRFNILIGIDVALAGVYSGVLFGNNPPTRNGMILVLSLGLIVSLLLYVQSAQVTCLNFYAQLE
jgi:hypothetical protein